MTTIDREQIIQTAGRIVNAYLAGGKDMNGSIASLAMENGYNNDQIRRLVEAANSIAYRAKHSMAPVGRKIIDFEVADADSIIRALTKVKPKKETIKISADASDYDHPPLVWELPKVANLPLHQRLIEAKTASARENIRQAKLIAEEAEYEKLATDLEQTKSLQRLRGAFESELANGEEPAKLCKVAMDVLGRQQGTEIFSKLAATVMVEAGQESVAPKIQRIIGNADFMASPRLDNGSAYVERLRLLAGRNQPYDRDGNIGQTQHISEKSRYRKTGRAQR